MSELKRIYITIITQTYGTTLSLLLLLFVLYIWIVPSFPSSVQIKTKKKNTISLLYTQTTHTRNELRCACVCVHACTCCFVSFLCISKFVFFSNIFVGLLLLLNWTAILIHYTWCGCNKQCLLFICFARPRSRTRADVRTRKKVSLSFVVVFPKKKNFFWFRLVSFRGLFVCPPPSMIVLNVVLYTHTHTHTHVHIH